MIEFRRSLVVSATAPQLPYFLPDSGYPVGRSFGCEGLRQRKIPQRQSVTHTFTDPASPRPSLLWIVTPTRLRFLWRHCSLPGIGTGPKATRLGVISLSLRLGGGRCEKQQPS